MHTSHIASSHDFHYSFCMCVLCVVCVSVWSPINIITLEDYIIGGRRPGNKASARPQCSCTKALGYAWMCMKQKWGPVLWNLATSFSARSHGLYATRMHMEWRGVLVVTYCMCVVNYNYFDTENFAAPRRLLGITNAAPAKIHNNTPGECQTVL